MGAEINDSKEQERPTRGNTSLLRTPNRAELQLIEGNKQGMP